MKAPGEYPEQGRISTTTHDLPTLAGFFVGRDIEARKSAGLLTEADHQEQWAARHEDIRRIEESLAAAGFAADPLVFLLSTSCTLAIVDQGDLTGEPNQQNLPATTWQHPNWSRKMRVTIENLGPVAEEFRRRIKDSGRSAT